MTIISTIATMMMVPKTELDMRRKTGSIRNSCFEKIERRFRGGID
jgi:hypothetical protein